MSSLIPEYPHETPVQVSIPELNLVVVRHEKTTLDALPALFDGTFSALGAAAEKGTFIPVGAALAIYNGSPFEVFDLEIGFPVAEPIDGPLELGDYVAVPVTLEPGTAWAASHVGSYEGLPEAWAGLAKAALDAGAQPTGRTIEAYVTEPFPGIDPSRLRTDLILPVV
ncbi:GyrI-like domain-containing protein [Millisia brevis]|uniref:GyrI-like domain-containing protein n=1 Tax=Millisia brevis TaxID=264148 RepID=UPI000A04CCC1|nr:GyrI-like domain-containing protein [Millisia brevis]